MYMNGLMSDLIKNLNHVAVGKPAKEKQPWDQSQSHSSLCKTSVTFAENSRELDMYEYPSASLHKNTTLTFIAVIFMKTLETVDK